MLFTSKFKNNMVVHADYVEVLLYDKYGNETGRALISLCDIQRVGRYRWYLKNGYPFNSKLNISLHRFIKNPPNDMVVDHINRNTLDNRRSNLRVCTHTENVRNSGLSSLNTTGFKGVYYAKDVDKYRARLRCNGESVSLGYYSNPIDAAIAYDKKAIEIYGEYAFTNFNREDYIVLDDNTVVTYSELLILLADDDDDIESVL